ncbi:MAG: hypothetical protein AAGA90_08890 [Actinomycetota bacterium]
MWPRARALVLALTVLAGPSVAVAVPSAAQDDGARDRIAQDDAPEPATTGDRPSAGEVGREDGLRVETITTYRVVPDAFAIDVEVRYVLTNEVPDRTTDQAINRVVFRELVESIPVDAVDVGATVADGTPLDVAPADGSVPGAETAPQAESESESESEVAGGASQPFRLWRIDLGVDLLFGQSRELTLRYRLPDGPPRDLDAWARINPAFVAFSAFGRGDDTLATVRIEVPDGFEVEISPLQGSVQALPGADGYQRWEAAAIDRPYEWRAFVVGSDERGLIRSEFEVPGVGPFAVAAWPGDTEWVEFVQTTIEAIGPFLEEAIGLEWPHDGPLQVTETVVPALAGYAGRYSEPAPTADGGTATIDALVEIGEDLNAEVLSHEISHAWFNTEFSPMRWLTEGLAEYYGYNAARAAGIDRPERFPLPIPSHPEAVDLVDWAWPDGPVDDEDYGELYGYSASFHVIDSLSRGTGADGLRAAVDTLMNDRNPYAPELTLATPVDWRRALDAFEAAGGADSAEVIFRNWVVGDRADGELDERRRVLDAHAALVDHELGWRMPTAVPVLLAAWDFEAAADLIARLEMILDRRVARTERAEAIGARLPDDDRLAYEAIAGAGAGDLADAVASAEAISLRQGTVLSELETTGALLDEPRGFVRRLGLQGLDPDAEFAAAVAAFADGDYELAESSARLAATQLEEARERGVGRLVEWLVYVSAVLIGTAVIGWLWWRQRRQYQPPTPSP